MNKSNKFLLADELLIVMMITPLICGMVLKVLTEPSAEGIRISGALVYFTIPLPYGGLPISESQVNSWLVIISILGLCLYMTHGIKEKAELKRQHIAEWVVEKVEGLIYENMGEYFSSFGPFVTAIIMLSAFSSLTSLLGLRPPTSDLNVVAGWAILVFVLITYYKLKCGPLHYVKSFGEPIPFLAPLNVISEVSTPVSMTFRHYGNILSGTVLSILVATGLQGLSNLILGWLPGILGEFPFLQIGLPAVLSVYFDVFSSCMQAYIFATLTMLYIADGFPAEDYLKKKTKVAVNK